MKAFYTDSQKLYTTGDILSDVRRAHADQRLRRKRSVGSRDGVKSLPWRGEGLVIKIAGAGFLAGALAVAAAQTRPYEQVEHGQVTSPDGTARVYTIRRLEPATFPQVPKSVRHELERRKCLIPQTSEAKGAENVISGEFREKGVKDWAALCSQEGYSTLLVFWRGSARTVAELGSGKDMDMMQTVDSPGEPGYSRLITRAGPKQIFAFGRNSGAGPIDHDGIDDGFLGKASLIHYFRNGKWERLEGAD